MGKIGVKKRRSGKSTRMTWTNSVELKSESFSESNLASPQRPRVQNSERNLMPPSKKMSFPNLYIFELHTCVERKEAERISERQLKRLSPCCNRPAKSIAVPICIELRNYHGSQYPTNNFLVAVGKQVETCLVKVSFFFLTGCGCPFFVMA